MNKGLDTMDFVVMCGIFLVLLMMEFDLHDINNNMQHGVGPICPAGYTCKEIQ